MHETSDNDSAYYTLVPEQGLCRIDDLILNLRQISAIRKLEGKTLVYHPGAAEPIILPVKAFDQLSDAVFAFDEDDEMDDCDCDDCDEGEDSEDDEE